jgi:hypothetical protein
MIGSLVNYCEIKLNETAIVSSVELCEEAYAYQFGNCGSSQTPILGTTLYKQTEGFEIVYDPYKDHHRKLERSQKVVAIIVFPGRVTSGTRLRSLPRLFFSDIAKTKKSPTRCAALSYVRIVCSSEIDGFSSLYPPKVDLAPQSF